MSGAGRSPLVGRMNYFVLKPPDMLEPAKETSPSAFLPEDLDRLPELRLNSIETDSKYDACD